MQFWGSSQLILTTIIMWKSGILNNLIGQLLSDTATNAIARIVRFMLFTVLISVNFLLIYYSQNILLSDSTNMGCLVPRHELKYIISVLTAKGSRRRES